MAEPLLTQAIKVLFSDAMRKAKTITKSLIRKPFDAPKEVIVTGDLVNSIKESFNIKDRLSEKIFTPYIIGDIVLSNRIVMAPMTRCRAMQNVPNELMLNYYKQRSGAGLIITEGTSPSPNGLGYARMPGVFTQQQIDGWAKITSAVHRSGGKIVLQLMHSGRISHVLNMPQDAQVLAPSVIQASGEMWTDVKQMQNFSLPKAMSVEDILMTIGEFVTAAKSAVSAGFDGVEIHGANGYLVEQFLSPASNIRTDLYGGSIPNRCRFLLELIEAVAETIGKDKVGVRLSPYGDANEMPYYIEVDATYTYLSKQLNTLDIAYIHLVDHSSMGAHAVPLYLKKVIRANFENTIILSGGYDITRAETDIQSDLGDVIAFGRPFINNPDLVDRFKNNWPLSKTIYFDLFYTSDEKGYSDYRNYKS